MHSFQYTVSPFGCQLRSGRYSFPPPLTILHTPPVWMHSVLGAELLSSGYSSTTQSSRGQNCLLQWCEEELAAQPMPLCYDL